MVKGYNLLISEAAELDIREAFLYYEEQSEKLGYRFERNVKSAMKGIKKAPLQNQVKYHEIRVKFLAKFPYGIHYLVKQEAVIIIAVFHTSQNPSIWGNRV